MGGQGRGGSLPAAAAPAEQGCRRPGASLQSNPLREGADLAAAANRTRGCKVRQRPSRRLGWGEDSDGGDSGPDRNSETRITGASSRYLFQYFEYLIQ